jgi:hypothetical protein
VSLKKNVVKIHFIFFNVKRKDKKNPGEKPGFRYYKI